jgi:chromosome partitioning protein
LSEAPSFGVAVITHDAESKGAVNYLNLAKELLHKNGLTKTSMMESNHDLN